MTDQNTNPPTDDTTGGVTSETTDALNTGIGSGDVLGATGEAADADSSAEKDPSDWVTGDEPLTGPQRSYIDTLAREAGEEVSADMTKAQASEEIDRLQKATGRGQ